jgi:hypothetical protein
MAKGDKSQIQRSREAFSRQQRNGIAKLPLAAAKNGGAIIVTCVRGRERQANLEILQVLYETPTVKAWQQSMSAASDVDGGEVVTADADAEASGGNDMAAALAQELKDLKGEKGEDGEPSKRGKDAFRKLDVGKGVVGGGLLAFQCTYEALDPVEITRDVFRQLSDPKSVCQIPK